MKRTKTKKVAYELIGEGTESGTPMYLLLHDLVTEHHEHLRDARIALAWAKAWKPDVDGRLVLGKCKKASDLDRELAAFDFVILLNRSFWLDLDVSDQDRRVLLDHELHHAQIVVDQNGDRVYDDRGRQVFRIRKHDFEDFYGIVERYGIGVIGLERLAAALKRRAGDAFVPCDDCREMNGWVSITDEGGYRRVKQCACRERWLERRRNWQPESATA